MTEELTTKPHFDKTALESKRVLEETIQSLYGVLITNDYITQGNYIPTMINLLEQWISLRDRINNLKGGSGWLINSVFKMMSAIELAEIANRTEARAPPINYTDAAKKCIASAIEELCIQSDADAIYEVQTGRDRANINYLKSKVREFNRVRASAIYVDQQEGLINGAAAMMAPITEIVFSNNLVKAKDITFARSEHAKSLDPKRPV